MPMPLLSAALDKMEELQVYQKLRNRDRNVSSFRFPFLIIVLDACVVRLLRTGCEPTTPALRR